MNQKQAKINQYFNQRGRLVVSNRDYWRYCRRYIWGAYQDDARGQDVLGSRLLPSKKTARARVVAKANGIVAGTAEVRWFLRQCGLRVARATRAGARVKTGQTVLVFFGSARRILRVERTLLNILQRFSGIATATRRLANKAPGALVCSTRKTPLGWLDKKAVVAGGGGTHRLGLNDFVLIKDNHWPIFEKQAAALAKYFNTHKIFWEIEVQTVRQLRLAAGLKPSAIMLDNFSAGQARRAIKNFKQHHPSIIWEVSGGINLKNISAYARAGADVISVGGITHSPPALNLSLEIEY